MLKKTITYTNYADEEITEDFYFNLSKAEILEMELSKDGGMADWLRSIVAAKDRPTLIDTWKKILLKAYGEKSADGKRFIKSEELSKAFSETEAYSDFFTELCTNGQAAADFINAIVPKKTQN